MIKHKIVTAQYKELNTVVGERNLLLSTLQAVLENVGDGFDPDTLTKIKKVLKGLKVLELVLEAVGDRCPHCGDEARSMESHIMKCKKVHMPDVDAILAEANEAAKARIAVACEVAVATEKEALQKEILADAETKMAALVKEAEKARDIKVEEEKALEETDPDYVRTRDEHITIPLMKLKCFSTSCRHTLDTSDDNVVKCFWEYGLKCPKCGDRMVPNMGQEELDQMRKARRRQLLSQGNVTLT